MRAVGLVVLLFFAATRAEALEKPQFGPPAAWVKPASAPSAPKDQTEPAVHRLLDDRQVHFGPEGDSQYNEEVTRIQSPLGLQQMGSVSLVWSPKTDTVTVHKLHIIRGGQVIDVLAHQSFTVIRREEGLPEAMLDGALTATLQPEGLQVGDLVDFAFTVTHRDPVLNGLSDLRIDAGTFETVDRLRIRATWDDRKAVRWKASDALGKPHADHGPDGTEVTFEGKDLQPLDGPIGAPARYFPRRELELSEFHSWTDVSALMAAYYDQASTLKADSPLKAEAAKIAALSSDPKVRAGAALKLVEDKVRYLALIMTDGGYTPVAADETWTRRFGDCKAKTVLLIALLRELGIQAEPALVSVEDGDGLDQRLPSAGAFDHVIVRAVIGGKVYWLDGTRSGDEALDRLPTPQFHWALPVRSKGGSLIALTPAPLDAPNVVMTTRVDATDGIDAPVKIHGEMVLRGDAAIAMNLFAALIPGAQRDKLLRESWKRSFPTGELKSSSLTIDEKTGEARLVMDGTGKIDWEPKTSSSQRWMSAQGQLGWNANFKREPGPNADAPYLVRGYPSYSLTRFILKVPPGRAGFTVSAPDIEKTVAGETLLRRSRVENDEVTIETSVRTLEPEFPASEAEAAEQTLKEIAKQRVLIRPPPNYRMTEQDVAAWTATQPKTWGEYVARGTVLLSAGKRQAALSDFEKAVATDPTSSYAYANRGMAHYWLGQPDLAKADFAKAEELDPRDFVSVQGQGMLALSEGRSAEAIADFTRASDLQPGNAFALIERARAYVATGEHDKALADLDQVVKLAPANEAVRTLRAQIYASENLHQRALAEIDSALAQDPRAAGLHILRGGILERMHRKADAEKEFSDAIAIQPTTSAYLTRASYREKSDYTGRLSDIDAALKLDPKATNAIAMRAQVLADENKAEAAIEELTHGLAAAPGDLDLLVTRGHYLAKAGRVADAGRDFDLARSKAKTAIAFNQLCWEEATAGYALETALADCNSALDRAPQLAAALDSRAFVLLRLGRDAEAVAGYDAALKIRPDLAASLYGRGLAKLKLGRASEGQADLAAAARLTSTIADQFASWGVPTEGSTAGAAAVRPAAGS